MNNKLENEAALAYSLDELLACRVCLATDTKLISIHEFQLADSFSNVMSAEVPIKDGFPQYLCHLCCSLLSKFQQFKDKYLVAQEVLTAALYDNHELTTDFLRNIDREAYNLPHELALHKPSDTINMVYIEPKPIVIKKNSLSKPFRLALNSQNQLVKLVPMNELNLPKLSEKKKIKPKTDVQENDPSDLNHLVFYINEDGTLKSDATDLLELNHVNADQNYTNTDENDGNTDKEDFKTDLNDDTEMDEDYIEEDDDNTDEGETITDEIDTNARDVKKDQKILIVNPIIKGKTTQVIKVKRLSNTNQLIVKSVKDNPFTEFVSTIEEKNTNPLSAKNEHPNIELKVLTLIEQIRELKERKKSLGYTSAFLKCDLCYRGFLKETSYNIHMAMHDPSYGTEKCPVCQLRCQTRVRLRAHMRATHERKYICRSCGHVELTRKNALEHQTWHEGKTYDCHCGMTFTKSSAYNAHTKAHRDATLSIRRNVLKYPQEFACLDCDIHFRNADALNAHVITSAHHSEDSNLWESCQECGQSFENTESLQIHSDTHNIPVKCNMCEQVFSNRRGLKVHIGQTHRDLPVLKGKKHICEFCGIDAKSAIMLETHKLSHTGDKPFKCTICRKDFRQAQLLMTHMRVHTGEAPYSCNICGRAFRHKANLNRHGKVHTGERPYSCESCGKSFTQSNSLKLHVRTVHLRLPDPYRHRRRRRAKPTATDHIGIDEEDYTME